MDAPFIAGFDGSPAAKSAVLAAIRLAASADAPVVVAHAFPPGRDIADARAVSDELLAQIGDPGVRTRSIAAHSAAAGLRDVAEYERAALLSVGRTHHGAVGQAVDTVPGELIHNAPCPVLIVPADAGVDFNVIGVAFDGRNEARAALAVGRQLARQLDARVVLLTVGELPELDETVEGLERRTLEGAAGAALEQACSDGIDLLIAGSRGQAPLAMVVAGSVSRHLAHHAPCPVLVVPRGVHGLTGTGRDTVSVA